MVFARVTMHSVICKLWMKNGEIKIGDVSAFGSLLTILLKVTDCTKIISLSPS